MFGTLSILLTALSNSNTRLLTASIAKWKMLFYIRIPHLLRSTDISIPSTWSNLGTEAGLSSELNSLSREFQSSHFEF